jgi:transposase-like protein
MMRAAKQPPSVQSVREVVQDVQGAVWREITTRLLRGLRALLEGLLEDEVTTHVGADRYERTRGRQGHRNGHYTRDLVTTHGPLPRLRVPRLLEGGVEFTLFDKYQRRQAAVDAAIGQLFLQGISTRKLKAIARDLFGASVSATTVSKTTAVLDADLQVYQTKPLTDDVVFLFLDGISQKVRELGIEGKVMLCAFGIHTDGTKELLSFRLADVEDTASWQGFLVDLKSRGLKGKALKLITVDGNPALLKALREVYPLRRIQRCIAHKLRNVVVKLKRAQREACMGEAKLIFGAPSRTEAIRRFRAWRSKWLDEAEAAGRCLEKDLFHCFHYFSFPQGLWRTIRTTNILERAFREVRRRTRPMGVFTNAESAERIMYGVTQHLNANWKEHPLRQIQQNA